MAEVGKDVPSMGVLSVISFPLFILIATEFLYLTNFESECNKAEGVKYKKFELTLNRAR